jgi:DedD protein
MKGSARRDGDRVLESRHLVGLFLGMVLLCCVFFTLGYVMGRTQTAGSFHARAAAAKDLKDAASSPESSPSPGGAGAAAPPGEWDFDSAKNAPAKLETPKAPAPHASQTAHPEGSPVPSKPVNASAKGLGQFRPPAIPQGAILLQLAALKSEGDALALADALQQKRFPAFVVTPSADNFYRVQVGPYADAPSANQAKHSLERQGFKVILKH